MGCDIHVYAERCVSGLVWTKIDTRENLFDWRSYDLFAFLAGVRNQHDIAPISEPRGIPSDVSPGVYSVFDRWRSSQHSASWLSLEELTSFDYSAPVSFAKSERRDKQWADKKTWREFLGDDFFDELNKLKDLNAERIVFWFDN